MTYDENKGWGAVDLSVLNHKPGEVVIVPEGDYLVKLIDVKQSVTANTKKGPCKIHRLKIRILEGEHAGVVVEHTCWLNTGGKPYAYALIATIVKSTGTNMMTRNIKDCLDKPFICEILKQRDKRKGSDTAPVYQNSMWEAKKAEGVTSSPKQQFKELDMSTPAPVAPAPTFDEPEPQYQTDQNATDPWKDGEDISPDNVIGTLLNNIRTGENSANEENPISIETEKKEDTKEQTVKDPNDIWNNTLPQDDRKTAEKKSDDDMIEHF